MTPGEASGHRKAMSTSFRTVIGTGCSILRLSPGVVKGNLQVAGAATAGSRPDEEGDGTIKGGAGANYWLAMKKFVEFRF